MKSSQSILYARENVMGGQAVWIGLCPIVKKEKSRICLEP